MDLAHRQRRLGREQAAWLVGEDGEPALLRVIADELNREPRPEYEVEILHGSYDVSGARLIDLVRVMDRLAQLPLGPGADPREPGEVSARGAERPSKRSTPEPYLREELGDLFLQIAFHSRIAEETPDEGFSIDDVSADIVEKLVRRHPHVFGDVTAADAAAVEANWETIKAAEKQRSSFSKASHSLSGPGPCRQGPRPGREGVAGCTRLRCGVAG